MPCQRNHPPLRRQVLNFRYEMVMFGCCLMVSTSDSPVCSCTSINSNMFCKGSVNYSASEVTSLEFVTKWLPSSGAANSRPC
jgi:hypothetical protein